MPNQKQEVSSLNSPKDSISLDDLIQQVEQETVANQWSDCPRVMSLEEMIIGLARGKTLCVDRRDAPELPYLLTLQRLGYVNGDLKEIDEQSSVLKFRWTNRKVTAELLEESRLIAKG